MAWRMYGKGASMNRAEQDFPVQVCGTIQEAFPLAAEAAAHVNGRSCAGILYRQGERRFICTSLNMGFLVSLIRKAEFPSTKEGKINVATTRNRPLDRRHRDEIADYLVKERTYILPPILLSSDEPLQIFSVKTPATAEMCLFVLPREDHLLVTDGQHRVEGIREALKREPRLKDDSLAVALVEEADIDQAHQDFYDAAQVKALPASLLVQYDQREPIHRLTKDLVREVTIFKDRIQQIGNSISKGSRDLFTNNQVKRAVAYLVSGSDKEGIASHVVEQVPELWRNRVAHFFAVFTQENAQWGALANRQQERGQVDDVIGMREKYLHCTTAGLLIMSIVGHSIFKASEFAPDEEQMTPEQIALVTQMAREVDWQRTNPMWRGNVVSQNGEVTPQRNPVGIAAAKVKASLGLAMTLHEQSILG
jgi:DNA sulfur modification protein DndB